MRDLITASLSAGKTVTFFNQETMERLTLEPISTRTIFVTSPESKYGTAYNIIKAVEIAIKTKEQYNMQLESW